MTYRYSCQNLLIHRLSLLIVAAAAEANNCPASSRTKQVSKKQDFFLLKLGTKLGKWDAWITSAALHLASQTLSPTVGFLS